MVFIFSHFFPINLYLWLKNVNFYYNFHKNEAIVLLWWEPLDSLETLTSFRMMLIQMLRSKFFADKNLWRNFWWRVDRRKKNCFDKFVWWEIKNSEEDDFLIFIFLCDASLMMTSPEVLFLCLPSLLMFFLDVLLKRQNKACRAKKMTQHAKVFIFAKNTFCFVLFSKVAVDEFSKDRKQTP